MGEGAYLRDASGSTASSTNALVGVVESGSSKKVRLVIKSDVLHIATSIGHVSSSCGNFTSPEYLVIGLGYFRVKVNTGRGREPG